MLFQRLRRRSLTEPAVVVPTTRVGLRRTVPPPPDLSHQEGEEDDSDDDNNDASEGESKRNDHNNNNDEYEYNIFENKGGGSSSQHSRLGHEGDRSEAYDNFEPYGGQYPRAEWDESNNQNNNHRDGGGVEPHANDVVEDARGRLESAASAAFSDMTGFRLSSDGEDDVPLQSKGDRIADDGTSHRLDDAEDFYDDDDNASRASVGGWRHGWCGYWNALRHWYTHRCTPPTLQQVAVAVVAYAPCFGCCPFRIRTDRLVLARLNVLLAIFALYQIGAGIFLAIVLLSQTLVPRTLVGQTDPAPPSQNSNNRTDLDDDTYATQRGSPRLYPALWNMNGHIFVLSVAAALVFASATFTVRVIRYVNLVGAIRYLWALSWAIPFETFAAVCLFDYHSVTMVWIVHWWRDPQMAWFRQLTCPAGTANTLCTVPIGTTTAEANAWCYDNYQSDQCVAIRDSAQTSVYAFLRIFYTFSAAWALCLLLLVRTLCKTPQSLVFEYIHVGGSGLLLGKAAVNWVGAL